MTYVRALVAAAVLLIALVLLWLGGREEGARAGREEVPVEMLPPEVQQEVAVDPEEPQEAEAPPAAEGEPWEIRVVDEAGAPVAGAWIEVYRNDDLRSRGLADGAGFATPRLTRGDDVVAGAPGFARTREWNPLGRQNTIVLRGAYRIMGVAVDAEGLPVPGVPLRLEEAFLPPVETATGPSGRFAFEGVGPDDAILRIGKRMEIVAPGDVDVRIVLPRPDAAVVGVVVFPDGSPAPGAQVSGTVADAEGRFRIEDRAHGPVELYASFRTPERRWSARVLADLRGPAVRIVLGEPTLRSCVRVRVLDGKGAPEPSARVCAGHVAANTNGEGRALLEFDDPPGAEVDVYVFGERKDGLLPGRAKAATSAPPGGAEIVLRPREPVPVTVIARGPSDAPLPAGVHVWFETFGLTVVRREDDRVVVAADPVAPWMSVKAWAPGYVERFLQETFPTDGVWEVALHATGTLRCRFVDAGGAALAHGSVCARVPGLGSAWADEADASGVFLLQTVPAGRAVVTAGHRSELPLVRTEALVEPGGVTDLGTLVLGEPRTVAGRVTDGRGRPVGGVRVTAQEGDDDADRTWSHADGSFRLSVPPWFAGRILARKPGYGAAHAPPAPDLGLALAPEGRVRLEARLPRRLGAWRIVVRDPASGFLWSPERDREEGTVYIVKGLPPGRVVLVIETTPPEGEVEVDVRAGETVPATVVVPE